MEFQEFQVTSVRLLGVFGVASLKWCHGDVPGEIVMLNQGPRVMEMLPGRAAAPALET